MRSLLAAGEMVIVDRGWYNPAEVEYVMGFCKVYPEFEMYAVDDGILLIKFWLEVSDVEQQRRFEPCISHPLRQMIATSSHRPTISFRKQPLQHTV